MKEFRGLSASDGAKGLSDLMTLMGTVVVGISRPVDGVLIEELSDQFMAFLAEEAVRQKLPSTVGLKEPLYVAYQSLIDVVVDLLRETSQIDYLQTCKAVVDVIAPIKESGENVHKSHGPETTAFEDNRIYRDFLRSKALVFILNSNNAYIDDAVFVLTVLRAGIQGLMTFHSPQSVRQYVQKRLNRLSMDIVEV